MAGRIALRSFQDTNARLFRIRCTMGPLKKSAKRQPYAAISPVSALTSKPALLREPEDREWPSQRRRSARKAVASRLRLMAAAVR
jgi:hypothetical protein